ncbi:MAG: NAD(P)H-quinone oxidoreductase [Balneolaceae bacterium]|nr:MAG: NAD(P)H-quinone oxidoreductase [Balneolaceae bacterium]
MKALLVDSSSGKPVMKIGAAHKPEPGEKELLVKIMATALNRADLLQKAGKYDPPNGVTPILGLEMAGVVEKTGPGVTLYREGDKVFGLLSGGGYAEHCTIHEDLAMPVPEAFSFEEAAAIPEVYLTAYQAIIWLAELKEKESILIHAGASGVGTAAIQLAKNLRHARVITTTGSDEKCTLTASLGADLCMNYKEEDYAVSLEETFGKNSVDVILDFVGSPYWEKNLNVMAMDGRLIYLSMLGGSTVENMSLVPILRKRLTIKGSTLRNRSDRYKIDLTSIFWKHTYPLFASGALKPVIDSVFNWEQCEEAHQKMEENLNAGKIILNGM